MEGWASEVRSVVGQARGAVDAATACAEAHAVLSAAKRGEGQLLLAPAESLQVAAERVAVYTQVYRGGRDSVLLRELRATNAGVEGSLGAFRECSGKNSSTKSGTVKRAVGRLGGLLPAVVFGLFALMRGEAEEEEEGDLYDPSLFLFSGHL